MFGTHDFLLFVVAGLLLNVTPGPDMLYIIARSAAQNSRAGAAAALGVGAGCLVHVAAAALGLSAVLAASATAFTVLKIAGAIYLAYVGIALILSSRPRANAGAATVYAPATLRTVFIQGFFTNVLNPKVALFFLAFLPQFIDADAANKALAFIFLGTVFDINGTLWNLFVAWFAARASARVDRSRLTLWFNRCIGSFFIYLGVRLAFAKSA